MVGLAYNGRCVKKWYVDYSDYTIQMIVKQAIGRESAL